MTTCGETLARLTRDLAAAGIGSARLDARLLLAHALGVEPSVVFSHPERLLTPDEEARIAAFADRRLAGEPVSRILGHREFWSLSFRLTAATLDPRPDTETLVEAALAGLPERDRPLRLLDLGTGSGCILLALLSELPRAEGLGIDASPAAVAAAAANAADLGLGTRARFQEGDWGRGLAGPFDLIVSNPPYIPDGDIAGLDPEVARFDPRLALAGGADGLDCYRRMAGDVARLLTPGGRAIFEVGQGQAAQVVAILADAALEPAGLVRDLAGIERCVVVSRPFAAI